MKTIRVLATSLVLVGVSWGVGSAHDLKGLVAERNSLDDATLQKFNEIDGLRSGLGAKASGASDGHLEAVVQRVFKWKKPVVTGCFFDGAAAARVHVVEVASNWTEQTSLSFDFGDKSDPRSCNLATASDIRVSFRGSGYWSYVGTQALSIDPHKQTVNLEGLDKANFTDNDDGVIIHEFGHAVGFEHEHQSPAGGCTAEFNWDYLYTALGWSKEKVDRNMKVLDVSINIDMLITDFDPASSMLYSLEPAAFKDFKTAKCFIPQPNNKISKVDREAMQTIYPATTGTEAPVSAPPQFDAATSASLKRLGELIQGAGQ